jgi:hypothetical protein
MHFRKASGVASCCEKWPIIRTSTFGKRLNTPLIKVGDCEKLVRMPTFGDNYFVLTLIAAAVLFGSSQRREIRKIMRDEFAKKSINVLMLDDTGDKEP